MLKEAVFERFDGGYQLTEDYEIDTPIKPEKAILRDFYCLFTNGKLMLKKGYAWNGANVVVDTVDLLTPSLIHDVFCQMVVRDELPHKDRWAADDYFYEIMKERGVPRPRIDYIRLGVKVYGRLWFR